MDASNEELSAALAGRYEIERELGRGGMAVVYLARDLRHSRRVAVKVLRPELATSMGGERFVREINIACQLTHPHILPLLDSGDAGAGTLLYYVMPYIAGETLRQRLDRERQLPVGEALAIARQVASALDYAHDQGIVHRDIKPENILLLGDEVLVADFGLARAIYTASSAPLTESGIAVGTPAYMSPEQASGDRNVDARADVYSLGCVLFEMIAGVAPFRGATAQALIAQHVSAPPPSLCRERASCPEAVDAAVQRALAKAPADRFRTAMELMRAAGAPSDEFIVADPPHRPSRARWRLSRVASTAVVSGSALLLLAASAVWMRLHAPADPAGDVVAVVPFRVAVTNPDVADLREGMVDLLQVKFPHAVDAGRVLRAWRRAGGQDNVDLSEDADLRLARSLGAGALVMGSVVQVPLGIQMHASLVDVRTGKHQATATAEGPSTSYPALVDTIANKLMSQQAGEERHIYLLEQLPTAAVSAYLAGKRSYRAGRYGDAVTLFERALDSSRVSDGESDFALAALGLVAASNYDQVRNEPAERGLRIAWQARDSLNDGDRAFLLAAAGPDYPLVSTRRAEIESWDRALDALPDEPEAYFGFGNALFHYGQQVEWDDALTLARKSFEQALHRDSAFAPALEELAELSVVTGDLDRAEQLAARLPDGDTTTDRSEFLRWRIALARGDDRALSAIRSRFGQLSEASAGLIAISAQLDGVALADGSRALDAIQQEATRSADRVNVAAGRYMLELNEGRPHAARADLLKTALEDEPYFIPLIEAQEIRDALFGGGDAAAAVDAVAQLTVAIGDAGSNPAPTDADRAAEYLARCAVEEWRLGHGLADSAAATLAALRRILPPVQRRRYGGGNTSVVGAEPVCPAAIEVWAAALQHRPDARAALDRLDHIMARGPRDADFTIGNLLVSRLRLQQGDTAGALRALRRRPYALSGLFYLAASLREEGRLAAATGDRPAAVRAYTHYLALRPSPEPSVQHEVDAVRAELARLRLVASRN